MRAPNLFQKTGALVSLAILFFGGAAGFAVRAQQGTRLAGIRFVGLEHFSSQQVSRATGLKIGDAAGQEQLGDAANRLAQSGAFDSVTFRYTVDKNQLTAEFQVKETQHLLPCRFDNLVWFSDAQLDQTLRSRVPFYAGVIPESGPTVEDVRGALREMIHANGIPGDVEAIPFAVGMGQGVSGISFSVKGVSLPIRSIEFPGAAGVSPEELRTASAQVLGRNFSISSVSAFASRGLISVYRQHGYLRARFSDPRAAVLAKNGDSSVQDIGVTLSVEEGPQFYWEKADWTGNRQFTAADLDLLLGMQPREIANETKIDAGVDAVRHAYGKRGFIQAFVRTDVDLKDSERLADYRFEVTEGAQFHFSQVHFDGLADKVAVALVKKWTLKPGDIFDDSYAVEFMRRIAPQTLQDFGVANASFELNPKIDRQNSSVDLHIVVR